MGINADIRDYKSAFKKHSHAYRNWKGTGSDNSKRLVLIYGVECGLKYLLMEKEKINSVADAQPRIQASLSSHDFRMLLKMLNCAGEYEFPPIRTVHQDVVWPNTYHQLCRYSIRAVPNDQSHIAMYDEQLDGIMGWLSEKVV